MTNFNLSIGAPASTALTGLKAGRYHVAPKQNEFVALVDGVKSPAWTTEGRGSHYVYFRQGDTLYYVQMAGPGELTAARQKLVVESAEYAAKFAAKNAPAAKKAAPAKPAAKKATKRTAKA